MDEIVYRSSNSYFADQLRHIMDKENLSIRDVAKKCGMTETSISRYLSEDRAPNVRDANWIFERLGYNTFIVKKESKRKENLRKNGSGCNDYVAYKAIKKADSDRNKISWLIDTFYRIANYAGFSIEERIVLRDKKSGKIYN